MAFVDEITLHLKAGRGGDGVVRWRREKGIEKGGPSGGNGGKGGDIYAIGVRDIGILSSYKNIKLFEAGRGEDGSKSLKQGAVGKDIEIRFPIGSKITNLSSGQTIEILEEGRRALLLKGGRGGLGNDHFKSSTNINPKQSTLGEDGEEADFQIELQLIVDLGLIGLPNAGKSSLLNALTRAKSKVGDFPFTTLEPNLGSFYKLILADIPGLIEGASEGKGLGHKFLKHIERTKGLIHCISSEHEDPVKTYQIVRRELALYNEAIMSKPEIIVLTKADTVSIEEMDRKVQAFKDINKSVFTFSILEDNLIQNFGEYLTTHF